MIGRVPASLFAIVLGLAGLGMAWRLAPKLWSVPAIASEAILLCAAGVWAVLMLLFAAKWLLAWPAAMSECRHPVQCCFVALIPVTTTLMGAAAAPYHHAAALVLFVAGTGTTIAFAAWRTGTLWQGRRDPTVATPVLYLSSVAGCFVSAAAAASVGLGGWSAPLFGAGVFSWLAIESVLLHRLQTAEPMQVALRPTLGIQLAPPSVGTVALLSVPDPPLLAAQMMLGYAVLQAAVTLRLMRWIGAQRFTASYWAFSFGLAALAAGTMRLRELGDDGPLALLALPAFILANGVIGLLSLGSLWLLVTGRLLPDRAAEPGPPA
ncbi:MAG: dicarboxylate transporter/tellurite-resistance protein TehA [Acetobacteraceae bacterium]